MKHFLIGVALGLLVITGCAFCKTKTEVAEYAPVPLEELQAHQEYAYLPCDAGYLVAFQLEKDYDDRALLWVAYVATEASQDVEQSNHSKKLDDQVVITVTSTPTRFVAITADFKENVVELYEEPIDSNVDAYKKTVWKGEPETVLDYLQVSSSGQIYPIRRKSWNSSF